MGGGFWGGFLSKKPDQIHLDPPVEGVRFTNIAVEVAPTGWVPPRWPNSTFKGGVGEKSTFEKKTSSVVHRL